MAPRNGTNAARMLSVVQDQEIETSSVPKMLKAVGYIRVSSRGQVDNGTSLEVQPERIGQYAAWRSMDLVDTLSDPAISGGVSFFQRPEGRKILTMVQRGEIDCVVVASLDRAFRDTVDCLTTVDFLDRYGVALHIIDLGGTSVDTKTPTGRFMLTVVAACAEMERGRISERCISGQKARRAAGLKYAQIPYGYREQAEPAPNGGNDLKRLVKDQAAQRIISRILTEWTNGRPYKHIAEGLNEDGVPTARGGGGLWQATQVMRIVEREISEGGQLGNG